MRKNGNVVLIAPREELALKEKQQLENAIQIGELEPLVSESFQLNYIKAQDLLNLITTQPAAAVRRGRGPDGDDRRPGLDHLASAASRSSIRARNILFVQDTASRLEEVRKIIRQIDTPIRQVLIEARIVIASDTFSQQLGVRFGQQTGFTFINKQVRGGLGRLAVARSRSCTRKATASSARRARRRRSSWRRASPTAGYSDSPQLNVNLPVPNAAGQLALTLINLGSGNLINLELSALEADNRGKVVSSPRVVTGDNQKAHIEQGTEIPYVTPGSAELAGDRAVQEGRAAARRDAADHAGQPHHHDGRGAQGLGRPVRPAGRRLLRCRRSTRKNVIDADLGQQRRHRGDRRHLRRDDPQRRRQGAVARRHPVPRLPVQADRQQQREGGAPDLPHAARSSRTR